MISFEDLEKHGYVRHYTDTPQAIENLKGKGVTAFFQRAIYDQGRSGTKLYYIEFWYWDLASAFPGAKDSKPSWTAEAHLYLENREERVEMSVSWAQSIDFIETSVATAYAALGCVPCPQ